MHLYIGNSNIPTYGMLIVIGLISANLLAVLWLIKKYQDRLEEFIILESYVLLGAFLGAKILYIMVSYRSIQWENIFDLVYFSELMRSGFVFYGGLIGGLIGVFLGGKLHKINTKKYIRRYIFLIPYVHAFGRIGCFEAGCCYGIPYSGWGAVIFPEMSFALSGIKLFPVQLVEAIFLFCLAVGILWLQLRKKCEYTLEIYLIAYGIFRFFIEYLRYDIERGKIGYFSTSQIISIFMVVIGSVVLKKNKNWQKRLAALEEKL